MRRRITLAIVTVAAVGAIAGGAVAFATSDSDVNVTGPQADRAVAAALEATGGGTANSVELDDENGATWEVEITKTDGTTVDVRLDDSYKVVTVEGDSESADNDDSSE